MLQRQLLDKSRSSGGAITSTEFVQFMHNYMSKLEIVNFASTLCNDFMGYESIILPIL
jgi:hypothetical protein